MIIVFLVYMLVVSSILALLEIQIEGKDGWAGNLPCWKIKTGFLTRLNGHKPLTGYHVFLNLFILSLLHLPLFFVDWSWRLECLLIGFAAGGWIIEDFLWFVFNPNYGIKNFKKEKIPWHKIWWGPVPDSYIWQSLITAFLIWLGQPALK